MTLRYNEFHGKETKNNIKIVDGKIDILEVHSIDGVTTCDFLLPASMKVKRIKEGKFNLNLTTQRQYYKIIHKTTPGKLDILA